MTRLVSMFAALLVFGCGPDTDTDSSPAGGTDDGGDTATASDESGGPSTGLVPDQTTIVVDVSHNAACIDSCGVTYIEESLRISLRGELGTTEVIEWLDWSLSDRELSNASVIASAEVVFDESTELSVRLSPEESGCNGSDYAWDANGRFLLRVGDREYELEGTSFGSVGSNEC